MALDKDILSALIVANMTLEGGEPVVDPAWLKKFADAVAESVVTHLITQGQCLPGSFNVALVPVAGLGQII